MARVIHRMPERMWTGPGGRRWAVPRLSKGRPKPPKAAARVVIPRRPFDQTAAVQTPGPFGLRVVPSGAWHPPDNPTTPADRHAA